MEYTARHRHMGAQLQPAFSSSRNFRRASFSRTFRDIRWNIASAILIYGFNIFLRILLLARRICNY